jgi:hypothetical protein
VKEQVDKISVAANGEILLQLASGGKPSYQYVYRAARGVYWDNERRSFTFAAGSEEPDRWIEHIRKVVEDELGIELILPDHGTV